MLAEALAHSTRSTLLRLPALELGKGQALVAQVFGRARAGDVVCFEGVEELGGLGLGAGFGAGLGLGGSVREAVGKGVVVLATAREI
jgi:hypothetical protein